MQRRINKTILIVGGGASGTILAAQLLKVETGLKVILVEKGKLIGRGLAYSTQTADHLLNVRAQNMSAFPDEPDHFLRWLQDRHQISPQNLFFFAPRKIYGEYLEDTLHAIAEASPGRLQLLQDEVVTAKPDGSGVVATLLSGKQLRADKLVLATGHELSPRPNLQSTISIGSTEDSDLDPNSSILFLGTGLSMIDGVLSLETRNHRGAIMAISRRGLMPSRQILAHPIPYKATDIPLGQAPSSLANWLRRQIYVQEAQGGNWRDVIDGLRPFNQRIWQEWTQSQRSSFLRHGKAWWDVHRHRVAPEIHDRILALVQAGRLDVRAARIIDVTHKNIGESVRIKPRNGHAINNLSVTRIYDVTGIVRNLENSSAPILQSLSQQGLARPDPLRVSLDVSPDCNLIGMDGAPSDIFYAVGPLTRGAFFEIDAIPEIRVQCAALAKRLANH